MTISSLAQVTNVCSSELLTTTAVFKMSSGRVEYAADPRKQVVSACVPKERMSKGDLFADIIHDRRSQPPLFFCVVQERGSREILLLGQYHMASEAADAAEQFMTEYRRKHVAI